jgi:TFIIF-interacting CTD phosphatase-like protein
VAQKCGDVLGIILSTLISRAGKLDPVSRSVDARSSARKHRRQLRMRDPTACTDCRCVRAVIEEQHHDRDVLVRHRHAECTVDAAKRLLRV